MKKNSTKKYFFYAILIGVILLIKGAIYSDISVEVLKEKYANEHSKFVEIDGMEVHYRDEGKGMPIVLIHGTGASLHTWDYWTSKLKEKHRVVRMDLPAFGLTGANSNGDYSIENYTNFLTKFLHKVELDSMYLVGNSLGGNIAWNFTAENPKAVKKLVLVDASGLPTNKPQPWIFKMAKTPIVNSMFLYVTPRAVIKDNIEQVYEDDSKISEDLITRYHEMALREGNRKAFIDRAKTDFKLGDNSNLEKLKSIQNKTLLIWGENDNWIPLDNGKRMDSLMPNSKLIIVKNSGHVPMEESPKESLLLFEDFINN
ncbi:MULTISPECIES: alpha/beta fold hydrolase [Tenacibaculum]|uniref:alpha/beta fold hydrolase n=1 Tax=Tenacibaculum TaxID=104267 RepID=UPI001F0AAFA9|nr:MULTISPECIES: alpha/beta hydrolase [Tenacibaculum]MCH3880889.1 alpha/beta hydrolase [Tenacibaculum aquimarinum]MDO6599512.1 alpha/beta hydrolase [Tenacibaculum sp. 1_MG-2023]